MRRRSVLKLLALAAAAAPIRSWRGWAQTVRFPGQYSSTLEALGFTVLPASLGRDSILRAVEQFERWVQDYRPGADTDHGYGHTHVTPLPASPAAIYLRQLTDLRTALLAGSVAQRQAAVLESIATAGVPDLSAHPRGKHVAVDLMSFYFHSDEANDLCYSAAIQRFTCRGVQHSNLPPPPLKKS